MPATDLRTLSRLADTGGGPSRSRQRRLVVRSVAGVPAATRRPRVPRWFTLLIAAVAGTLVYVGVAASGQTGSGLLTRAALAPAGQAAAGVAAGEAAAADDSAGAAVPRRGEGDRADRGARPGTEAAAAPFAEVDGLVLALPHPGTVAVAYHEASRPEALELAPVGRLEANDNATKYAPPPDAGGPAYRVLSSRGRARPATSAVDLVVPSGASAHAPVTGTVVEARQYVLYGGLRDWRVAIEPDDRTDLHVVLIHLHEPSVKVGDRVEAGRTPVAVVRQLPFTSHVDYAVEGRLPHLHLEVKPATAPQPVDPNAPAMDAAERLEEVTGRQVDGS